MADNVHEGDLDLSDYPEGNLDGWFDTVEEFLENDFIDQRGVLKDGYFGKYILLHIDENDFREERYSNVSNVSAVWRAGRGTPTEFKDALSGTISKEAIDNDLKDPPDEDEVVVLLYTRSWQPITSYSKRSDQFPYDCDECLETLTYAETIQVDPNDAWIRCCSDCFSELNLAEH